MKTLKDKVVVITGAGGTIAGAVEAALREVGARVVLVDKDIVRIRGRASSYNALALESDLATLDDATTLVAKINSELSRIDGLIHLVGELVSGTVETLEPAAFDTAFNSNMRTLFYISKAILPELRKRDEAFIVGMGSQGAWHGETTGSSLFAAAKSAVATYLRSLDGELADTDISVSTVFPVGAVDTHSNRNTLRGTDTTLIAPSAIARALVAAVMTDGGRLTELAVYPPRNPA